MTALLLGTVHAIDIPQRHAELDSASVDRPPVSIFIIGINPSKQLRYLSPSQKIFTIHNQESNKIITFKKRGRKAVKLSAVQL